MEFLNLPLPSLILEAGLGLVEMMAEKTQIFPSKGEARKMIAAGRV
jgi:hypothetical protein